MGRSNKLRTRLKFGHLTLHFRRVHAGSRARKAVVGRVINSRVASSYSNLIPYGFENAVASHSEASVRSRENSTVRWLGDNSIDVLKIVSHRQASRKVLEGLYSNCNLGSSCNAFAASFDRCSADCGSCSHCESSTNTKMADNFADVVVSRQGKSNHDESQLCGFAASQRQTK
jgi:hypothetical protein